MAPLALTLHQHLLHHAIVDTGQADNVRHTAIHEQKDDVPGPRRKMRLHAPCLSPCPLIRQTSEGQPAKSHARATQEATAAEGRPLAAGATSGRPAWTLRGHK